MLYAATAEKPHFSIAVSEAGLFCDIAANAGRRMAKTLISCSFVDAMWPSES